MHQKSSCQSGRRGKVHGKGLLFVVGGLSKGLRIDRLSYCVWPSRLQYGSGRHNKGG